MKQAYLSVVLPVPEQSSAVEFLDQVARIDLLLASTARMHEVVLVALHPSADVTRCWREWVTTANLDGPVSLVVAAGQSVRYEEAMIEGLARCVGDFVIEWEAHPTDLDQARLFEILAVSEAGNDIVVATPTSQNLHSRAFYTVVNRYRTVGAPLQPSAATLYSRAAVDRLVDSRQAIRHRKVLIAQSGLPTSVFGTDMGRPNRQKPLSRLEEVLDISLTATRVGTRLTYFLAIFAALGGLATALYALIASAVLGTTPEGWVTLMVTTGISFAAVLFILALLGETLSRVLREVQGSSGSTVSIEVVAPRQGQPETAQVPPATTPLIASGLGQP